MTDTKKSSILFSASIATLLLCWSSAIADTAFPEQLNWQYSMSPDILTGEFKPQAAMMSRNSVPLPPTAKEKSYGVLAIRKESGQQTRVLLRHDTATGIERFDCKPSGCFVKISFDGAVAVTFRATPVKDLLDYPILELPDANAFLTSASRAKRIEAQFHDRDNRSTTYLFTPTMPLEIAKIKK